MLGARSTAIHAVTTRRTNLTPFLLVVGELMRDARWLIGAALMAFATPASAETLKINTAEPAAANVVDLIRISVERFAGEDGAALAQALEAELDYVVHSLAGRTTLAENYVGLPFDD